jgi:hypothetical protein
VQNFRSGNTQMLDLFASVASTRPTSTETSIFIETLHASNPHLRHGYTGKTTPYFSCAGQSHGFFETWWRTFTIEKNPTANKTIGFFNILLKMNKLFCDGFETGLKRIQPQRFWCQ